MSRATPDFTGPILAEHLGGGIQQIPLERGHAGPAGRDFRLAGRRHGIEVAPERIVTLNGTREGLFNAALALSPEQKNGPKPAILIPNPFYQVYAVAAAAVGAEPVFVPATTRSGNMPRFAGSGPGAAGPRHHRDICVCPPEPAGPSRMRNI